MRQAARIVRASWSTFPRSALCLKRVRTPLRACLQVFKLKFLLPYLERLLRLADNKTLRAELTAFPLAVRQADAGCSLCFLASFLLQ